MNALGRFHLQVRPKADIAALARVQDTGVGKARLQRRSGIVLLQRRCGVGQVLSQADDRLAAGALQLQPLLQRRQKRRRGKLQDGTKAVLLRCHDPQRITEPIGQVSGVHGLPVDHLIPAHHDKALFLPVAADVQPKLPVVFRQFDRLPQNTGGGEHFFAHLRNRDTRRVGGMVGAAFLIKAVLPSQVQNTNPPCLRERCPAVHGAADQRVFLTPAHGAKKLPQVLFRKGWFYPHGGVGIHDAKFLEVIVVVCQCIVGNIAAHKGNGKGFSRLCRRKKIRQKAGGQDQHRRHGDTNTQ